MAQSTPKQLLEGAVSHAQESVKSLAQSIGVQLNSQFAENAFFWNVVINHRIRDPENDAIIHGYTALGSYAYKFYFQYLNLHIKFRVRDSIDDGHFSEKLRGYIEDLVEEVDGLCAKYELFKNSGKINATIGVKFVEEIRRDYPERKHEVDFLPPSKSMKTGEAVKVSKYDSSDELRTGQMASFEKPVTMVDSGFSSSAEPQSPNKHHHGGLLLSLFKNYK
jgi:hypothetical protein